MEFRRAMITRATKLWRVRGRARAIARHSRPGLLWELNLAKLANLGKIRQIKFPPNLKKIADRQIKFPPNLRKFTGRQI